MLFVAFVAGCTMGEIVGYVWKIIDKLNNINNKIDDMNAVEIGAGSIGFLYEYEEDE